MEKKHLCPICWSVLEEIESGDYWCRNCGKYYKPSQIILHSCTADTENDPVNHPSHYNTGKYECLDVLKEILTPEQYTGFCIGNTVKYIWRCGKKDPAKKLEDMEKALFYLDKAVKAMEEE